MKKICYLVLIYIIIVSLYFVYKLNQKPKYNQELFDEIYSQYENLKDDNINSDEKHEISELNKTNPTFMKVTVQGQEYKVIGKIVIDKINLEYPIIADTTDENLKIAPTKLCGPLINTTGNLCIIGHNYINNKLFSNIPKLQKNDIVTLYDNNNNSIDYEVYDKYIVNSNNVECLNQNTNNNIEVTLITCTNKNDERLIVKCQKLDL